MRGLHPRTRETILQMAADGVRFSDIAAELVVTKGQVAGVVHRAAIALGHVVKARNERAKNGTKTRLMREAHKTTGIAAAVPRGDAGSPSTPSPVPATAASIVRRETGHARTFTARACQFIAGEPSADDACKCGRPILAGFSYCEDHAARCYQPRRARGEDAPAANIDDWNKRRVERLNAAMAE